jgi:transposase InsO family protein
MDEKVRENIALFRFSLIAPLLQGQVASRKAYLESITARPHEVPYYGLCDYSPQTIAGWLRDYRREGFEGLKPKRRSDRGRPRVLSPELQEQLLALRQEERSSPASVFYDQLVAKGVILPDAVSYATIYRFLKSRGLLGRDTRREPERKRFAYETVNTLWQGDVAAGPYLRVGNKKVATFLFAFIDDCSRLVPFAQFSTSEKFEPLKVVLKEAILRRGIPKMIYVDNGKIYRSEQLQLACAALGIALINTKPYDPQSKGKIERFFLTVRQRFLPLVKDEHLKSLDNLNRSFWQWLEKDYHRQVHSALGMSPLDKFMSQFSQVKMVSDPAALEPLFFKREERRVHHDATISINKRLFEVPPQLIGNRIEVRFDPEKLDKVFIFVGGKEVGVAKPVEFSVNARAKRESRLSFASLQKEEQD